MSDKNPCAEILNHKWLDPQCVASGCQSLFLDQAIAERDAAIERLTHVNRWAIEERGGSLFVCFNEHSKTAGCTFIEYVPATAVDRLKKCIDAQSETCAKYAKRIAELEKLSEPVWPGPDLSKD